MTNRKVIEAADAHINFRLPAHDLEALRRIAEEDERSLAWVARRAVRHYVKNYDRQLPDAA